MAEKKAKSAKGSKKAKKASPRKKAKPKAKSAKATKPNKAKMTDKKNPAKIQPPSAKQMTLGFEPSESSAKRIRKIGKRHGAKKAKK